MRQQHWQPLAQPVGDDVLGRQRDHIARRALQHRHRLRGPRQGRHQGHRGGAATDHDDPLAGHVQPGWPMLRMDERAGKIRGTRIVGHVAVRVVVIAAAAVQKAATQLHGDTVPQHLDGPMLRVRRPVGANRAMAEAYPTIDAVGARRVAHIVEDRAPLRDRFRLPPGTETVAERVHVGVRTHAGIAEQVPGAADRLAPLQDQDARAGTVPLQVTGGADAGQPGADDDDVEMLRGHAGSPRRAATRLMNSAVRSGRVIGSMCPPPSISSSSRSGISASSARPWKIGSRMRSPLP